MTAAQPWPYRDSITAARGPARFPRPVRRPVRRGRPAPTTTLGVLGGSFDPPHRGHLHAALAARRTLRLRRVVLVPAARPPHKPGGAAASPPDRWRMTRLLAGGHPGLTVSRMELRRRGPSFTVTTLRALRRRHRDLVFIIGADTVPELPTWHRWREVLGLARIAAVTRPGHRLRPLRGFESRFTLVPVRGLAISSSRLRATLARGRNPGPALPRPILRYIRRRGLYRS